MILSHWLRVCVCIGIMFWWHEWGMVAHTCQIVAKGMPACLTSEITRCTRHLTSDFYFTQTLYTSLTTAPVFYSPITIKSLLAQDK